MLNAHSYDMQATASGMFNNAHNFTITDSVFNAAGRDVVTQYLTRSFHRGGELKEWLAAPDCSTNYTAALNKRVAGTGQWIFEDPTYLEWKRGGSILWIHGKAGSGKTFLM
ncbi:hypothetical protein EV361DRAFT_982753 [Lentinula raphanica]|nr:hypothetical protein EV361DRAFT_982753 [Lentinula raphanica]